MMISKIKQSRVYQVDSRAALDLKITHSNLNEMSFSFENQKNEEIIFLEAPETINVQNELSLIVSFTHLAKTAFSEKPKGLTPHDFETDQKTVHNLPSGAKTGILLHSILESLPLEKYCDLENPDDYRILFQPFLAGTKFDAWRSVFQQIIFNVLNCSLDAFKFKEIDWT